MRFARWSHWIHSRLTLDWFLRSYFFVFLLIFSWKLFGKVPLDFFDEALYLSSNQLNQLNSSYSPIYRSVWFPLLKAIFPNNLSVYYASSVLVPIFCGLALYSISRAISLSVFASVSLAVSFITWVPVYDFPIKVNHLYVAALLSGLGFILKKAQNIQSQMLLATVLFGCLVYLRQEALILFFIFLFLSFLLCLKRRNWKFQSFVISFLFTIVLLLAFWWFPPVSGERSFEAFRDWYSWSKFCENFTKNDCFIYYFSNSSSLLEALIQNPYQIVLFGKYNIFQAFNFWPVEVFSFEKNSLFVIFICFGFLSVVLVTVSSFKRSGRSCKFCAFLQENCIRPPNLLILVFAAIFFGNLVQTVFFTYSIRHSLDFSVFVFLFSLFLLIRWLPLFLKMILIFAQVIFLLKFEYSPDPIFWGKENLKMSDEVKSHLEYLPREKIFSNLRICSYLSNDSGCDSGNVFAFGYQSNSLDIIDHLAKVQPNFVLLESNYEKVYFQQLGKDDWLRLKQYWDSNFKVRIRFPSGMLLLERKNSEKEIG